MKKILVFICCFALCFSMMVVSAGATELDTFEVTTYDEWFSISDRSGYWDVDVFLDGAHLDTLHSFSFDDCFFKEYFIHDGLTSVMLEFLPDAVFLVCSFIRDCSCSEHELLLRFTRPASSAADPGSPLSSIIDVFSDIGNWLTSNIVNSVSLFWNADAGSLTFIGVLAVCGIAISIIFLLIYFVVKFLRFGG